MNKRVGLLVAITLTAWALLAYPAQLRWGETALVYSATAMGLCLLPTAATLLWAGWAGRQSPDQQLVMVLGGTGLRMGLVLGVGLALYSLVPYFGRQSFWVWIVVFYLLTLGVEVVLVVRDRTALPDSPGAAPVPPASLPKNV